jgi:hypothetical protein
LPFILPFIPIILIGPLRNEVRTDLELFEFDYTAWLVYFCCAVIEPSELLFFMVILLEVFKLPLTFKLG